MPLSSFQRILRTAKTARSPANSMVTPTASLVVGIGSLLIFLSNSHLAIVGWKKQITKLHKEGKKAASKKKDTGTNLY